MNQEERHQGQIHSNTDSYPSIEDVEADTYRDIRGSPNRDSSQDKNRGVPSR